MQLHEMRERLLIAQALMLAIAHLDARTGMEREDSNMEGMRKILDRDYPNEERMLLDTQAYGQSLRDGEAGKRKG